MFVFEDSNETRTMHSRSDSIEIMIGNETNEIIEEILIVFTKISKKLRRKNERQQNFFDNVDLLHYRCHRVS